MAKEDMGSVSENTELSEDIEQLSIPNVSHDMLKKIVDGTEESRCPRLGCRVLQRRPTNTSVIINNRATLVLTCSN